MDGSNLHIMDKIAPLISSSTAGPLGVVHLPRLWLKMLLGGTGHLAEGYKDCGPGYDYMVCEGLGIKPDDARKFVHEHKPSYVAFEKWVKAYPGAKLDKENIAKLNASITGYNHDDGTRKEILGASGVADDHTAAKGACDLNNLDDWQTVHAALTKH